MLGGYRRSLGWVVRHPARMLALTVATASLSIYLYVIVPMGFFPQQDTGRLQGNIQFAPSQSFSVMNQRLEEYMKIVRADPAIQSVAGFVGGARYAQFNIQLKPLGQRNVTADQVIARLRPKLNRPGASLFLQSAQEIRVGARGGNAQFQYTIQADTVEDTQKWAAIMLDRMKSLPEMRDSNTDL